MLINKKKYYKVIKSISTSILCLLYDKIHFGNILLHLPGVHFRTRTRLGHFKKKKSQYNGRRELLAHGFQQQSSPFS